MWLGKLSLKAAAVVLVGMASSAFAQGIGAMNISAEDWDYLSSYKLWGTSGITFGNRPEFYDSRHYNRTTNENDYSGYTNVDPDTLGWVGTAKGNLTTGERGWLDGPIIVGGAITGSKMKLVTGPIRTSGNVECQYRGTKCGANDKSGACANVPLIRSDLSVPGLTGVNLDNKSSYNASQGPLDVDSYCPGNDVCDIYLNSIDIANDTRFIVQMPAGGRPTRIFVNKLNFGTHPQIVVSYKGQGILKQTEYQGNLLIYVKSDITFANIDNVPIMGTIVSTGTIKLLCNVVFAGQLIANKIEVGNEIRAENFVFKKFDSHIELSILDEKSKKIEENNNWETINVGLNEAAKTDVSFNYCFEFHSADGIKGQYAGYADVGAADASHKFPICNKNESVKVTIPAGSTTATGINVKPLIDGIVETDEALWFQVSNLEGASLTSDYEDGKGYKIYIVSNDKLPTGNASLVVDVDEDTKHVFTEAEFKFQHSTQKFASVIITSLPAKGTIALNGTAITSSGKTIAVADLAKLTYQAPANEFGKNYTTFKFKVVGDGTADNTSAEYTAKINVVAVNDKPTTVSKYTFAVSESPAKDESLGYTTYDDVSNEKGVDTYKFALVTTDANYTEFSKYFVLTSSGEVKVKGTQTFDYYTKSSYTVTATVTDDARTEKDYGVTRNGPQTSKPFTITVNVKNQNHAPTIASQPFTIPEKQADGSDWTSAKKVGDVDAKDPDGDNLTYKIADSGIPFAFKSGTNSLMVSDGSKLDYETKSVWTFKVTVTDPAGASATATITVNLTDVNEKPIPSNVKSEYSVAENKAVGTVVGTFQVFDNDKSSSSYETLTYTLSGSLTNATGGTTATNLSQIFEVKETGNTNGTRTVSILVKNKSLLDYEALYNGTNATYPVTIIIADAKNSVTVNTKIAVLDVNEEHTATGGTFYLLEHSLGGENVCAAKHDVDGNCADYGRIVVTDPDIQPNNRAWKFKMSTANTSNDAKAFMVDYQGYVKASGNVDFEYDGAGAKLKYTFLVTVYDDDFSKDVEVTVNIEDIEEPKIQLTVDGAGSIKENAPVNTLADKFSKDKLIEENPTMAAEFDKIGEIYEYEVGTVKGPHGSDIFTVDPDKGNIIVDNNTYLNFEELFPNNSYEVQIIAKGDKGDLIITRTVVVQDVNEKPVSKDTAFSVKETIAGGTDIGKLLAWDPDSCSTVAAKACKNGTHTYGFNKLVYTIVDDTDLPFEIGQGSGIISLKQGEKLNFTDKSKYEFKVKISDRSLDSNNPPLSTTATVIINVVDVNRPSEFKVLSDLYETEENVKEGTSLNTMVGSTLTVGKIVVYDEDAADIDKLKISITDKDATTARDAAKLFEVVQEGKTDSDHLSTFVIKTKGSINYEELYKATDKNAIFNVTLTIDDGSTEFTHTSQTTMIRVIDVNEEPSVVEPTPFTIAENTTNATSLGFVKADDPDIYNADFGTLYFSLDGAEAAQFDIDTRTGELFTINNAKFDYETKSSYKFEAVITDKKHTKRVDVIVNIIDMPEVPKFPDNPPALAVDENTLKGTVVGVVTAEDDDCKGTFSATCKQPTYTLAATDIDADDYKSFTIDKTTGIIKVAQDSILNFEVQKEYSVRVVATDGDEPTLTSYIDVTIKVNDVNDAPTYDKKEYVFEIHENAPKGEFIGTVNADDEDTWSKLTFALSEYVSGSGDTAPFEIDDDGSIFLATKTLNYEKQKEYMIWATATDNGKDKGFENYKATTLVTIKIIDDPDKPIIKDDGKPGYDVAENTVDNNTPTGFEIACYEVSDEDKGQVESLVAYVKDAGNTDADRLFDAKVKKDGSAYKLCLTVKNGDRLNYEAIDHTHKVIVAVMDADNLIAEVSKTINLTDVNEMPIISGNTTFSFYDRNKVSDVVGKLYPDDIDTSKAFIDDVFSVVGGDTDVFEITEDGKIKAKKVFDFQNDTKLTYTLDVALSDRDSKTYPKLTVKTTITITIKNRPKAPEITSTEFKVKENSDGGTPIGTIEAKDPDGDDDKLLYELTEENPYVTVTQSGEIKVKDGAEIDYEKIQEFTISVTVKDIDGMETDGDIVIKVVDVNEAPKIESQEFKFPEDSKPGTKQGPIEAKDPDTKNPDFRDLKFYPVEENDKFEIKTNGDVVLKGELDYETEKSYVIKVYVTDGEFNDTTDITINVGNVIERSDVQITRVEAGDSVYLNPKKEDIIYTNKEVILVEWKQDGKTKSSLDTLKEGCQQIIKSYKDPSKDIAGADTIEVCYSTASPVVDVFAPKTKVEADNIFTVVEEVDKKDSSIYVNDKDKDVKVTVKDTVSGYTETFNVTVVLDTVAVPDKAVKTLIDVAKSQPSLDKNPKSGVSTTPVNDNKTVVSYKEKVDGHDVVVSYNVDSDGEIIKVPVIGEDGQKKMTEVIEVSTTVEVKGKTVVVSYKADAETGKMLYGDSEGNLMVDVPSSSSSKPSSSSSKKGDSSSSSKKGNSSSSSNKGSDSDEVDLKTGVGAFTVTYDAKGVEGNKATVSYVIDEKGKIVANDEGDRGYLVTYTYTNKYGNSADKSVFMVLDKIKPFVKILSPSEGDVIYANYVDVDWCISIDGDKDNCVKQDTLNFESLHKGVNTIKRIYRDKAGNEMVAEVSVMMKKAKDVNIDLEKPMILVAIDSVDKYYSSNPPEEDQSYAVSILNPTSQKEKEVVKGFDGSTKKGSGDEPYPGLDGHLGPTIKIDTRLPIATSVGGLATLDDIVINGDMVVLDEVDAADAKKVTVKEYVKEYCSDEFRKEWSKSKDFSKMTLYSSNAHVTLWFYTTGGQFIDKFKFDYDIDDPDYVDKAGLVKFFFEMKPDMNGELRDTRGRLYGTGPFIVKTQVDIRSKLRCMVPPINENSAKIGDVLKSSDELLTRFGYRRPVLHGNERPLQNTSKKSSKKSSKK